MVKAKHMGTFRTSKVIYASWIILKGVPSFMVNLILTEDMCSVFLMHLQYASYYCKILMSWFSVSKTYITSMLVVSCRGDRGVGLQIGYTQTPVL